MSGRQWNCTRLTHIVAKQEDLSALLWTNTTLADCLLQGQTEVDKGITAVIPMHRSILHARCPALRSRLAQAQAQLQPSASVPGQVIDQTLDARGPTVVVKVDSLFKAEHCQVRIIQTASGTTGQRTYPKGLVAGRRTARSSMTHVAVSFVAGLLPCGPSPAGSILAAFGRQGRNG